MSTVVILTRWVSLTIYSNPHPTISVTFVYSYFAPHCHLFLKLTSPESKIDILSSLTSVHWEVRVDLGTPIFNTLKIHSLFVLCSKNVWSKNLESSLDSQLNPLVAQILSHYTSSWVFFGPKLLVLLFQTFFRVEDGFFCFWCYLMKWSTKSLVYYALYKLKKNWKINWL